MSSAVSGSATAGSRLCKALVAPIAPYRTAAPRQSAMMRAVVQWPTLRMWARLASRCSYRSLVSFSRPLLGLYRGPHTAAMCCSAASAGDGAVGGG